jgi:hypothetical protein
MHVTARKVLHVVMKKVMRLQRPNPRLTRAPTGPSFDSGISPPTNADSRLKVEFGPAEEKTKSTSCQLRYYCNSAEDPSHDRYDSAFRTLFLFRRKNQSMRDWRYIFPQQQSKAFQPDDAT